MKHAMNLSAVASAILMFSAGPALAQGVVVGKANPDTNAGAQTYWTPERFRAAKPFPLPQASPEAGRGLRPTAPEGRPASSEGHAPVERIDLPAEQLYLPEPLPEPAPRALDREGAVDPGVIGTYGAPYTSTRVFPMFTGSNAQFSADRAYPYSTVGKLFFSIGGSPYVCSAAVIQRRVVATAGHCVHSGTAAGFHSNFVFVPAFRDGAAPLGRWNWNYVATTSAWVGGGGGVPNAADYAMIEFADQSLSPGAPVSKLGNVTGWLGWQTVNLAANHTSKLGYPCNLDSCQKMQNVQSNNYRATAPNNVEYGSDARGGSSGGPWVQNFATLASGGGGGTNNGLNQLVGVTSYGYNSADPKVQGASILDNRFIALLNQLCARPGNCN